MKTNTETPASYMATPVQPVQPDEEAIISKALDILKSRIHKPNSYITGPDSVRKYLAVKLCGLDHEVFGALMLNSGNGIVDDHMPFAGGIDECRVYVRMLMKRALEVNATGMILYHNHPSHNPTPSEADKELTLVVQQAAYLLEIRVLDHLIVGGTETSSFAELGLLQGNIRF